MDDRKYPRFPVAGEVTFSSGDVQGRGRLDNLSRQGAAIVSDTLVPRGDYLSVRITIPNHQGSIEADLAPVRWVRGHQFGVEFIRIQPASQQALRRMLDTLTPPSA
jgi:hypothetical protein